MNFDRSNPFADLESDLDASRPAAARSSISGDYLADQSERSFRTGQQSNKVRVEVKCESCRGSGRFISYSGRVVGDCFKCHGKGVISRAANYEVNKAKRAERKEQKAREAIEANAARITAWAEVFPAEFKWIVANRGSFDFAAKMEQALEDWGRLTDGQLAAVQRCVAREQEKAAQRAAAQAAAPAADAIDVSGLKGYYAVPNGDTRLKLRVKHPGKDSSYHGWVFVDDGAAYGSNQKYGSQRPGGKYQGKVQEQLRAILADPYAAQVAYGKLTGVCGHCGRPLEDAESVARGIGPVCAAKYGY
jgi:hypothetical protein